MSTLSLIPEERRKFLPNPSKSTESLYSSSSSKYSASALLKRKAAGSRQPGFIPAANEVRQRVLSARRLRVKTLQNQLSDAQQHISELANENRMLRTLHKRQDSALSKYENTNAELPQLLHSHAEEVRIWQAKYRSLHSQNKELVMKLKHKESMMLALGDQNKHLTQLNRDKNLEERERLTERVRYLESSLTEKDNDMKLMARRLQLEAKNFKTQLQNEQQKYKQVVAKLERSRMELGKISQTQFDIKDKLQKGMMPRSLSGSKLPKHVKDYNRLNQERAAGDTKYSLSTPSLCEDKQPNGNRKSSRSAGSSSTDSPKPIKSLETKSVRNSSTSRPSRRDQVNHFDSSDLAHAIEKGMSKLLGGGGETEKDHYSSDDELCDRQDKLKFTEQPNPSDEENGEDPENYEDDENQDCDENDSSADVIVSGKLTAEIYQKDEIELKTRQEFVNIRQQMSEDYRQRETFLDTFCRQSSTIEKTDVETSARRAPNIDSKKKNQLLAALKAIETEEDVQ